MSQSKNRGGWLYAADYLPRMMPGQEPYTEEEWKIVVKLIHDAATGDPGEDKEPGGPHKQP